MKKILAGCLGVSVFGALSTLASGTTVSHNSPPASAELRLDPCVLRARQTYSEIQSKLDSLVAFIKGYRSGVWKPLRNFVIPALESLKTPAFVDSEGQSTKITDFKTQGGVGTRRITNFESSTAFGSSRWELSADEAAKLCGEGLSTEYKILAWSGYNKDPKRSVSGTLKLNIDLADLKYSIEQIRKTHVMGKSPDKGHQHVDQELAQILTLIERTQRLTEKAPAP